MSTRHLLTIADLLLFSVFANAQSYEPNSKEVLNKIHLVENNLISWVKLDSSANWNIHQRMKESNVNGLSIAVINDYKIEWVKSYGWADTSEKRLVTNSTLFQSASIGKSINGFAFMKLAQERSVDLSADINSYLQDWKFPYDTAAKGKPIHLAHILSHTAGLSVHGFDGYKWNDSIPTLKQILDGKKPANNPAVRSQYQPGQKFEYSGGGYQISELIAENITHLPYEAFIRQTVLEPLKMTSSTYELKPGHLECATAYHFDGKDIGCKYHLYPEKACGAGLWTTATDLAKFVLEVQLSLRGSSNKIINTEWTKRMLTPYLPSSNYGFGFFIDQKGPNEYFQHSGLNEGFSSQFFGSVKEGKGVVVLTNSDNMRFIEEIINSVATVYHWENFYSSVTKKIVAIPDTILDRYIGKYRFKNEATGPVISKENGSLYLQPPGAPAKWRMYFTSKTEFFMLEARWANQQFYMNSNGKVAGHYILGNNYKEPVSKIE